MTEETSEPEVAPPLPAKRGRGRPKKAELAKKKSKPGPQKGDAAIINEYKARMLASPQSQAVLDAVFKVALDDDHKNQAACMKMVMDRVVPVSFFEKDKQTGGVSGITISIQSANPSEIHIDGEVVGEQ